MWYDLILYDGTTVHMNVMKVDSSWRGVDMNGNDLIINANLVQAFRLADGNNDYFGYSSSTGGDVGIGYG
jgi:hypothetical protein